MPQDFIQELQAHLRPARQRMVDHSLYCNIQSLGNLRVFMEYHVFAVWDFMSLLKALQRDLTCTTLPWVPTSNPATRRLINGIVLEEEADPEGRPTSHFELYLRAMQECGADTAPVQRLLAMLAAGVACKSLCSTRLRLSRSGSRTSWPPLSRLAKRM